MGSFHSKQLDNKRCTVEVRWGIIIENLIVFFFPKSIRKYSHTYSYFRHGSYFARRKVIITQLELGTPVLQQALSFTASLQPRSQANKAPSPQEFY